MSKYKVSISFKQNALHLYEYLKTKDNISSYLCKLIEADMYNQQNAPDLEAKVEEIVYKLLQNKNLLANVSLKTNDVVEKLSEEDIDLINQLF
ncbi:hypothetical protein [Ureibacillus thermosphaericus]|uniref:hypothetical protein n=1 Tax=Ureibacillus thermosphaericus TaxID=51173 RepID=UPI000BBCA1BC|nr:hypothetical protein [Ureibacillus thermosphaericus]